jgi:hypothetical protein
LRFLGLDPTGYPAGLEYITKMGAQHIFRSKAVGMAWCMVFLIMLASCIVEPLPRRVYVEPAPEAVVVPDDYIYYPDYEIYYNPYTQLYWYMAGGVWVSGPIVPGIAMRVMLRSPSVRLNFSDSVANHHAMVARQFPRGWRPLP